VMAPPSFCSALLSPVPRSPCWLRKNVLPSGEKHPPAELALVDDGAGEVVDRTVLGHATHELVGGPVGRRGP